MADFSWRSRREVSPSPWTSDEVAVGPGGLVHHHPLPPAVRVILVVYGVALGVLILALAFIFVTSQRSDQEDREKLKQEVVDAIEADNAARLEADAKQQEATRKIVCSLVEHDLPRSPNTVALARQLRCGQPPLQPSPESGAQPAPGSSAAAPPVVIVTIRPQPAPAASPGRSPAASPAPRPSPSPTCTVYNPVTGRCVLFNHNTKERP